MSSELSSRGNPGSGNAMNLGIFSCQQEVADGRNPKVKSPRALRII